MDKTPISQVTKFWSIPVIPIILVYLAIAASTAALLGPALFWDDWIVVGAPRGLNIDIFTQAGTAFGWTGRVHSALSEENLTIYRLALVVIWAFICAMFGWIAQRHTQNWQTGALIAMLAMMAPLNSAKLAIINTPAILCLALFMIGWIAMRKSIILATAAFLVSFTLPSLLFLYALAFAEYVGQLLKSKDRPSVSSLLSTTWLATLPPLYWLAKSIWLQPYGIYQGYNKNLSLQNAVSAAKITITDIKYIAQHLEVGWYIAASACAVALFPLSKRIVCWALPDRQNSTRWTSCIVISGVAALILATTPYLIAGHAPRWAAWDSRNQILIPFAFSILVVACLTRLPKRISAATLAAVTSISLVYWSGQGYLLWRDWQKQKFIQVHWASNPDVAKADIVILDDKSSMGFANRRLPRFYELSGILADAYGDERRIGVEASQWTDDICDPDKNLLFRSKYYRTGDAEKSLGQRTPGWTIVRTTLSDKPIKLFNLRTLTDPVIELKARTQLDSDRCLKPPSSGH